MVDECPRWTLNCSMIRWWKQSDEKTSTRYQWLSAMRPWSAKLGQGHGSSLMAANPFLSHHVPHRRTCAATSQHTSYFPQYYSQNLNGQVYRRLFATEVLEERPLSTAFWTSCHWLFCMDNVLFCFSIGRTRWTSHLVGTECTTVFWHNDQQNARVYAVDNHCSTPLLHINYIVYPENHFTQTMKYLTVIISISLHFLSEHLAMLWL